jgi:WD40 repeat protein
VHEFVGHAEPVRAVLFPNESRVISSTNNGMIRIWDVSSGIYQHELIDHTDDIPCLVFHGSVLVSGSSDSSVLVWNIETGECIYTRGARCKLWDSEVQSRLHSSCSRRYRRCIEDMESQ